MFENIRSVYPRIVNILKKDSASRDDDNRLITLFWQAEGIRKHTRFSCLKNKLINREITSPETIRRTRQKIQEQPENAHLRGDLYDERHAAEARMRNQMKFDF